ncbi:Na-Ca exchanger/integrin-beta4 [Nostoc sp. NIES-4103]|nr:Na-Ca exchanger/integrin-beta4 [Nostoc sp. NIES-4103]
MKLLSTLAISAYSISLSFITIVSPAHAAPEGETDNSSTDTNILSGGFSSVEGQLENEKVDFYNFSNFEPGKLFTVEVNSQSFDPLLGQLDNFGNIIAINDDQSDNNVLPILTGEIPASGSLNFGVSGLRDINLRGNHFESGLYTLSLKTFALPSGSTNSTLVNGGFETGNFNGWTTLGSASIETATFGSGPTQGNSQALLSTGGATFNDSILEKFLALEDESLNSLGKGQVTQGSAIQQTFTAKAGDILSFDWDFLTNEVLPPITFSDFSFVSISSQDNSVSSLLALADVTNTTSEFSLTDFFQETGFQTFSFKLPTTGTYTLGLGVLDVGDGDIDSGLLIDNFKLTSVPEPTSGLSLLGFSTLVLLKFRRKIYPK